MDEQVIVERAEIETPLGRVLLFAHRGRLVGLEFADRAGRCAALRRAAAPARPRATRAVAAANAANPVALFVPCHRVIASDGTPHGYGGGVGRKRWLLAHEAAG